MKNIKVEPQWSKTKEEIWNNSFEQIVSSEPLVIRNPVLFRNNVTFRLIASIAAVYIVLLIFSSLYEKSYKTGSGERVSVNLPDGSTAILNSQSTLSYKPVLWFFRRDVKMNGEIFFSVKKGSDFRVNSSNGIVSVLGTKFNVFSRDDDFDVICYSGKVGVEAQGVSIGTTLEKNSRLYKNTEGIYIIDNSSQYELKNSWVENNFLFKDEPLKNVLNEIERQYSVQIFYRDTLKLNYTGNFTKLEDPLVVLEIITLPFGFKVEQIDGGYNIVK